MLLSILALSVHHYTAWSTCRHLRPPYFSYCTVLSVQNIRIERDNYTIYMSEYIRTFICRLFSIRFSYQMQSTSRHANTAKSSLLLRPAFSGLSYCFTAHLIVTCSVYILTRHKCTIYTRLTSSFNWPRMLTRSYHVTRSWRIALARQPAL